MSATQLQDNGWSEPAAAAAEQPLLIPVGAHEKAGPTATPPSPHGADERRATPRTTACRFLLGKWKALAFGQLLSLVLAGSGFVQSALYLDCHLSAPTFSMLTFYFPLSVICISRLLWQERRRKFSSREISSPQLPEPASGGPGPDHEAPAPRCTKQPASELTRNRSSIAACTEKRDHLLSRWFQTNAETTDAGFYLDGNLGRGVSGVAHERPSRSKAYSLFGLAPLRLPLRTYAAIAVIDVYANYTTILAFKFTTITSVSLFDALAIPSAIVLSRFCFGRRYTKTHLLGVAVCGVGILLNVLQDYREDKHLEGTSVEDESAQEQRVEENYPYKMRGDILAITGGLLFGISNTLQEVAVRDASPTEYLACMALFASVISGIQVLLLEREAIAAFFGQSAIDTCSEGQGLSLLVVFALSGMVNCVGITLFLQIADAAFFNLGLLTGDAWAVVFSIFAQGIVPPSLFYAALALTLSGVFIYETAPSPVASSPPETSGGLPPAEICV